jgi:hypothetical protein
MPEESMDPDMDDRLRAIEVELRAVGTMPLNELRGLWATRWGQAPSLRSVDLLRSLIAWQLQAELLGGLDAETKTNLRRTSTPSPACPPAGSRLTREYRGVLHHVDVDERGFRYQGTSYRSLSAVARRITGTRWNGPRFFGLRNTTIAR